MSNKPYPQITSKLQSLNIGQSCMKSRIQKHRNMFPCRKTASTVSVLCKRIWQKAEIEDDVTSASFRITNYFLIFYAIATKQPTSNQRTNGAVFLTAVFISVATVFLCISNFASFHLPWTHHLALYVTNNTVLCLREARPTALSRRLATRAVTRIERPLINRRRSQQQTINTPPCTYIWRFTFATQSATYVNKLMSFNYWKA
jgi:hypothetical protein